MERKLSSEEHTSKEALQAGTGFMASLTDAIKKYSDLGYTENLIPKIDHLEARSGELKFYPDDLVVDKVVRFENTSDPDDQSILYVISFPKSGHKGLYVDSYGTYHDELSHKMIETLVVEKKDPDCRK